MKNHNLFFYFLSFALLGSLFAGCATTSSDSGDTAENSVPATAAASNNGYPTQTRVEYVLQCMQRNGGQSYDTLYPCVCSIDQIATAITPDEFAEAQTFSYLRSTPGEAGGVFRDPPHANKLRKKLDEAEKHARKICFVKKVSGSAP